MEVKLKDMDGWPLVIDARVRISYGNIKKHVTGCSKVNCLCKEKPKYKNGIICKLDIDSNTVDVREFDAMNVHTVRPNMLKVMKGKTRKSYQYDLIRDKFRRRR